MVLVEVIIKKAGKKGEKGEKNCTVDRILGAMYYCYSVAHYLVLCIAMTTVQRLPNTRLLQALILLL